VKILNDVNIQDYLIEHSGFDWAVLLEEWSWLVPPEFTVRLLTRAGDLFIELPDGSFHILETGGGELKRVAESHDELRRKLAQPDIARDWLMIPVIDRLVADGCLLGPNQCYGFRKLPILGGGYDAQDRVLRPIAEHFGVCGSLHRQVAGLPDGAQVRIEVTD
jgi:hypothetical protein